MIQQNKGKVGAKCKVITAIKNIYIYNKMLKKLFFNMLCDHFRIN